jgi:hypothetical protein
VTVAVRTWRRSVRFARKQRKAVQPVAFGHPKRSPQIGIRCVVEGNDPHPRTVLRQPVTGPTLGVRLTFVVVILLHDILPQVVKLR